MLWICLGLVEGPCDPLGLSLIIVLFAIPLLLVVAFFGNVLSFIVDSTKVEEATGLVTELLVTSIVSFFVIGLIIHFVR